MSTNEEPTTVTVTVTAVITFQAVQTSELMKVVAHLEEIKAATGANYTINVSPQIALPGR